MEAVDALKSVLCGPDGKCCIAGSQADRDTVDTALASVQHYLDQNKAALPVLPEWSKQDNLGGLVPSEIRMSMRDFGQQCAAQARKLALEEAEKRMLTKAAELGIYNHHATKALVEALKGEVK